MQKETALMKASSNGHLPVAKALIQAKADVNATDVSSYLSSKQAHTQNAKQQRLCYAWLVVQACVYQRTMSSVMTVI